MTEPHFAGHRTYGHESSNNLTDYAAMRNKSRLVKIYPASVHASRKGCDGCSLEQQEQCKHGQPACEGEIDLLMDSGEVVRM